LRRRLGIGTAIILMAMLRERPTDQSQVLFVSLSVIAFAYCLLCGVLTTSDCVSEGGGTDAGVALLTDLRGYDVVIGKLVASSVRAVSAWPPCCPSSACRSDGRSLGDVVWTVAPSRQYDVPFAGRQCW
jgi:hypothetical protein